MTALGARSFTSFRMTTKHLSSRTNAVIAKHPRRGRTSILHLLVVPNERSNRGALPKGKDLALPLPCHPDGVLFAGRISALNLDCLRGEILHFVQDDKSEVFPLRGCSLRLAWVLRERDRASPFGITKRERDPSALPRPRDDTLSPARMQLVVVPSERSDRGASPKGVRDLGVDSGLSQERDPSPPGTRSAMEPPSG